MSSVSMDTTLTWRFRKVLDRYQTDRKRIAKRKVCASAILDLVGHELLDGGGSETRLKGFSLGHEIQPLP